MYKFNLGLEFEDIVRRYPNNIAIKFDIDNFISYFELNKKANQIANLFSEKGIKRNDVVSISSIKTTNTFACILACLKIGAIYTMVDRLSPVERLNKIISNCLPKLVCADEVLKQKLKEINHSNEIILFTTNEFENLIDSYNSGNLNKTQNITGSNPAYIMYTSGSTGFPKGATMTHANVLNFISWSKEEFALGPKDTLTNVNPLFFDNSVFDLYSSLFSGACLIPFDREKLQNPTKVIEAIDKLKCASWFSVPSLLIYLNSLRLLSKDNMKSVKRIIFGGEGYPKPKLKMLYELYSDRSELINVYGPTECTCICSAYRIKKEDVGNKDLGIPALGKVIKNFDYLILDGKGNQVNADEIGELCLLGPQVGMGYYNDPERTKNSFIRNHFNTKYKEIMYKTGDLVKYSSEDQNLYFVSRKDYQIKHMGYRIELGEIEYALNSLSYVSEAAVIYGRFKAVKQIVAVIKLNEEVEETRIRSDLKKIVPDYMLPRKLFKVKEIAKNPNGKIDRKRLAELYLQ